MIARWLIAGALAAGLTGAASAQVVDGPTIAWKLGTWGKPRANTTGFELVKKYVEEKTGGKFTITIGYESFGTPKELLDLVKVNALDACTMCSSYYPDKLPATTGLDLPFLPVEGFDQQHRMHEIMFRHPVLAAELATWNARSYLSSVLPQYEFMGKGKPPRTLEDFKGMRVRAIGGLGDAMRKLGAVPTSMDATEVYTALERGTVDAASFPSTYAHGAYKLHEVSKWLTVNMSPGAVSCPVVLNITSYDKLPPQYQKLLEEVKPAAYAALKAAYKAGDDRYFPEFEKKKITLVKFGEAELAQFRKVAAEPVWEEWAQKREAQGIPGRELLRAIMEASAAAKSS
jgi:TRAP-type C4-dicarboxylate transport system substrate-binding protein